MGWGGILGEEGKGQKETAHAKARRQRDVFKELKDVQWVKSEEDYSSSTAWGGGEIPSCLESCHEGTGASQDPGPEQGGTSVEGSVRLPCGIWIRGGETGIRSPKRTDHTKK